MNSLLIKNVRLVIDDSIVENGAVLCKDGKIVNVYTDSTDVSNVEADNVYDGANYYLAPGFIDLHIHGAKNILAEAGPEELKELTRILPQYGVTGFLPTICPRPSLEEDVELLKRLSTVSPEGTAILGFMMEGHFLSLTGAIKSVGGDVDPIEKAEALIKAAAPYNLVFAISPEFKGIVDVLPILTRSGMPAFITHTFATDKQTLAAIEAGAKHATHFYNVFPYGQDKEGGVRRSGAIEAIFSREDCTVDFILDGEHVEPLIVKMALVCKGKDSVCLITDANINAGMPPGRYEGGIGNTPFVVAYEGGPARNAEEGPKKGGLIGSGLTMNLAVKNAINMLGVNLCQAVRMASTNPARVIKVDNKKGKIKVGYDADMVLLDENCNVQACWVMGDCKYEK
ncbi:MAG TPA: amidohydrolase family protein [Clostridiaceae bacterium]|nr:amidohydrolase family protein [Clostridiaceae bacterium]